MPMNPSKEYTEIMKAYKTSPKQGKINALILGESGAGKTFLMRTCPKPVLIDSFDPGGTKGLRPYIEKGDIIADVRWEQEDPLKPSVYAKWKRVFQDRRAGGFFDYIGTYVIDSSTSWGEAIMNGILMKAGIAGQAPRFTHDYVPQKVEMINILTECLSLPCHFILLGHHEIKDDVNENGKAVMRFRFLTTGKAMITIPLKFDEIYTLTSKQTSAGITRSLITVNDGVHQARSRMAGNGLLAPLEEPDITKLLKKAGLSYEDLPLLQAEEEE